MKKALILAVFVVICYMLAFPRDYDVTDFGIAPNDTVALASTAFNHAIEACSTNGGGRVVVPAGKYRCGTIMMRSDVELHLCTGAYLYASDDRADFPMQSRDSYRSQKDAAGWNALIYAAGCHDIALTGSGTIDGRGAGKKGHLKNVPGDGNGRPKNILFISCSRVRVSDVTVMNSPMWNQHYLNCEDVMVTGIHAFNHCNGNNDGIDIDGCRRFILTGSIIDSDDDGIVLKSTGEAPCEDVIVNSCIVSSWANAIKLGTESTGGYRNILISDCIVKPSRHKGKRVVKSTKSGITAISLEVVDGGVMEHVSVDNILIEGTECPLYVRLANRGRRHIPEAATPAVGRLKDISISNITAYGVGNFCSSITGIDGFPVENVGLRNITVRNRGGLEKGNVRTPGDDGAIRHDMAGNRFTDLYWADACDVKEDEKGYPQPTVWGNLPSYGLFLRHVKDIRLENVDFSSDAPDPRPAVIAVDVSDFSGLPDDAVILP